MNELISNIIAKFGLPEQVAKMAVGLILGNLQSSGPADLCKQLFDKLPGASALVEEAQQSAKAQEGGGGLAGMVSAGLGAVMPGEASGIMKTLSSLQAAGVDASQVKNIGDEVLNFAREKAGDDLVGQIVSQVPGLDKLLNV